MGPLAAPAIPALLAMLDDPWPLKQFAYGSIVHESVRQYAATALLAIGPAAEERLKIEGLPRLVDGMFKGDDKSREHAVLALTILGPKAKDIAPVLAAFPKAKSHTRSRTMRPRPCIHRVGHSGCDRRRRQYQAADGTARRSAITFDSGQPYPVFVDMKKSMHTLPCRVFIGRSRMLPIRFDSGSRPGCWLAWNPIHTQPFEVSAACSMTSTGKCAWKRLPLWESRGCAKWAGDERTTAGRCSTIRIPLGSVRRRPAL